MDTFTISYSVSACRFGKVTVATTETGVCCISFAAEPEKELQRRFKKAELIQQSEQLHQLAVELLNQWPASRNEATKLPLHLIGTDFQIAVWKTLLNLNFGETSTYKNIALQAGRPKAIRATGTAIGQNPVAVFIPCHRVLTSSGQPGGYRWGVELKKQLLLVEKS